MRIPSHAICQHTAVSCSVLLVCALIWQPSAAQTVMPPDAASAANPSAPVPVVAYRSVFKETSLGVEIAKEEWRKANDEVGKFTRGHVDILKWEEQEGNQTAKPANTPAPAHKH